MTAALHDVPATLDDAGVHFGLVELDLLAAHAGAPMPFPLRVPSFGRIPGERAVLLDTAGFALRQRGLADARGPLGAAAELVTALREYRGSVDLVAVTPQRHIGAVALVYRSSALLCEQELSEDDTATVRVRRVADTALAAGLRRLVPRAAPARTMPIMLPSRVVDRASRLAAESTGDAELVAGLRALMRDYGGDPDALDQLAVLLSTLTGRGQLGATRRTGETVERAGSELSWLDGPRGRVRVHRAPDWFSVNPLRPAGLRFALDDLAMIARERR
ncbi:MAG TPA: ESX secretion-associated protein EspG [Pseudonocardiaceae bacterium]|jgi:hypothetical protein|nr:ESX secretion-associated protein EspG [Pseudonocardiaceae bacterium]